MKKTKFHISQMDCPSEEQLIKLALGKFSPKNLQFDLPNRGLTVFHDSLSSDISQELEKLNLGSRLVSDEVIDAAPQTDESDQSKILKILLLINFFMFCIEIVAGIVAHSAGLVADSFDMLADAIVYAVSLYAVGRSILIQNKAARLSGWFQLLLAAGAFAEVIRRLIFGSEPHSGLMMGISLVALIANISCLALLMKHRKGAVHMQASWIFSSNDVIANIGVIIAGVLVSITKSSWPDVVIGTLIAILVTKGALTILKLSNSNIKN
ncbi:MAG: cation transporter [Oligoflexia bacterium]|nr:cation transporter [Oligoflexia bacterium]